MDERARQSVLADLQQECSQDEATTQELDRLRGIIERDRTAFCLTLETLKAAVRQRALLCEGRAASGYAHDEDGFIREFGEAYTEILGALEKAHIQFRNFDDCPTQPSDVSAAQAEAIRLLAADPRSPAELFAVEMLDFQPLAESNCGLRFWQILEAGGLPDGRQVPALLGALQHALGART